MKNTGGSVVEDQLVKRGNSKARRGEEVGESPEKRMKKFGVKVSQIGKLTEEQFDLYYKYRSVLLSQPTLLADVLAKFSSDKDKMSFFFFLSGESECKDRHDPVTQMYAWDRYCSYPLFDWGKLILKQLLQLDKEFYRKVISSSSRWAWGAINAEVSLEEFNDLYLYCLFADDPINNRSLISTLKVPADMVDKLLEVEPRTLFSLGEENYTYERSLVYLNSDGFGLSKIAAPHTVEQVVTAIRNHPRAVRYAKMRTQEEYEQVIREAMKHSLQIHIDFDAVSPELKDYYFAQCVERNYIPIEYLHLHRFTSEEMYNFMVSRPEYIEVWYLFYFLDEGHMRKILLQNFTYPFSVSKPNDAVITIPELVAEHTESQLLVYRDRIVQDQKLVPFLRAMARHYMRGGISEEALLRILGVFASSYSLTQVFKAKDSSLGNHNEKEDELLVKMIEKVKVKESDLIVSVDDIDLLPNMTLDSAKALLDLLP